MMLRIVRTAVVSALMVYLAIPAAAQSIFTVAGGGSTDQRSATEIQLRNVRAIAVDSANNIYFSEADGHVVQRIDAATGTVSVYAGNGGGSFGGDGGPATLASLKSPIGLAFDDADNLFIADRDNNRIRRVDRKTGVITTIAGVDNREGPGDNGPAKDAFIYAPTGLAWSKGSLYITQDWFDQNVVRKIDANGVITAVAGSGEDAFAGDGGPATAAKISAAGGVALDSNGNIYIADSGNARIRRVDAVTKNIETVVGSDRPNDQLGDGGPGTDATLFFPRDVAVDAAGKVYIADAYHNRIRRWDPATKIVTTVAGDGTYGGGDGNVATSAGLAATMALAFDHAGNLFVEDGSNSSIRRIDAKTQIITTIAGGGTFVGDGLIATSAVLSAPRGIALDRAGNLYISDSGHTLVRKVDAATHVISTFAGSLNTYYGDFQDGDGATTTGIGGVNDVAINDAGDVFIANPHGSTILRVDTAGKIFHVAGGGNPDDGIGDGGPATSASFSPRGIGLDAAGNIYIADTDPYSAIPHHRIRRVDAQTRTITTIAGGSTPGFDGDGGDAKAALLNAPNHAVVDNAGNIFIADAENGAIRRIDGRTNIITTYAGRGNPPDGIGDGLVATQASLYPLHMTIDRATGDLYFADMFHQRIRKIDARTQIITTVAGTGETGGNFGGDNGPAASAKLNLSYDLSGVAVDRSGNVILSDTNNHRMREVFACVTLGAPSLTAPGNGSTNVATSPLLSWNAPAGAFRYDVFLDTIPNPARLVASDIDKTSFTPSNLAPSTLYYWSVKAKGDPFCPNVSTTTSAVLSFTTSGRCAAGAFDLIAPADGATNVTSVTLSWQASAGAASYDVYFGNVNPPPFLSNVNGTSISVTPRTGTNYWTVIAHASCDARQTASTPVRSFTPASTGTCTGNAAVTLVSPAGGATGVASSVDLTWRADTCAGAPFDVYLGTQSDPPLVATNVAATTLRADSLLPSSTYFWKVTASNLNGGRVSSSVASFTTRSCVAPDKTLITFVPSNPIGAGSTYTIVWKTAAGLDPDGGYLVERSTSPSFATVESQVTLSAAASFIAGNPGTYYHRVRGLPSCDPTKSAPPSDVAQVSVIAARPNVVFTVQPAAVVSALGDRLEDKRGSFTLENIGSTTVNVSIGRTEINNSPPFFTINDPQGNDVFVTLEPRKPRTFEIRYSGPSNTTAGSYQGVIQVAGGGLSVIPYAFVELRVGDATGAVPQFLVNGVPSEYLSLAGRSGTNDTSAAVSIRNSGSTPMDLASEVGPEVWVAPERGWNGSPVAPNTTRTLNLNTRRLFAPNGSPLPRYTYFTVRTKQGASARLLVQDNDAVTSTRGRTIALGASERSFIVPEVTSRTATNGSVIASRIRLTNAGTEAVNAELIFTPASTDGFDAAGVRRAIVVAPPNDVVTLIDPLTQLMGMSRPASGQLEIRIPNERLGLIGVNAATVAIDGNASIAMPLVNRFDGARGSDSESLFNLVEDASTTTSLILAETSGLGDTTVRATLFDSAGARKGDTSVTVKRYGYARIDNVVSALGGGSSSSGGRIELSIISGSGSVIGVAIVRDRLLESGATFVSAPSRGSGSAATPILRSLADVTPGVKTTVVPVIGTPASTGAAPSYKTSLTLSAASAAAVDFKIVLKSLTGGNLAALDPIRVSPSVSVVFNDVMKDLFAQTAATQGSLFIDAPPDGKVSAVLQSGSNPAAHHAPSSVIPVSTVLSELVTSASASMQRPLFFDGLEQSTDPARGSRWLLLLNEIGGSEGQLRVLLFEAGNRSSAIADKTITIRPYEQMTLDTVFAALGLDAADRKKDRTNVGVTVIATSGSARVTADVISVDNRTGDTKVFPLTPSVGSATSGGINFTAVPPPSQGGGKRRAVKH
jgi:sugar lactone lactonase YvrE